MSIDRHAAIQATKQFRDQTRYIRIDIKNRLPTIRGYPYLLILPFFVLFGIFLAFPVFYTLYLSFFEYVNTTGNVLFWITLGPLEIPVRTLASLEYVGLRNYQRLLSDELFHKAVFNTVLYFVVQVPIMITLGLGAALALNSALVRFKGAFRTIIAIPVSANIAAYSTVFLFLFSEQFGLINYVLRSLGVGAIPWLSNPFWARITIISAITWRWTGYVMIILLAGLQNINPALYESAEIDGANRWQKFRYVTLPQLRPVMLFVVVIATIGTFKLFAEPFIITKGGPSNATITIVQYIYRQAFRNFNLGYASALTYVLVFVVAVLSIIQIRVGGEN